MKPRRFGKGVNASAPVVVRGVLPEALEALPEALEGNIQEQLRSLMTLNCVT